jgi:hypothetical protein
MNDAGTTAAGNGAPAKFVSTNEAERKRRTICAPFSFEGYRSAELPATQSRFYLKIKIFRGNLLCGEPPV